MYIFRSFSRRSVQHRRHQFPNNVTGDAVVVVVVLVVDLLAAGRYPNQDPFPPR